MLSGCASLELIVDNRVLIPLIPLREKYKKICVAEISSMHAICVYQDSLVFLVLKNIRRDYLLRMTSVVRGYSLPAGKVVSDVQDMCIWWPRLSYIDDLVHRLPFQRILHLLTFPLAIGTALSPAER